MQPDKFVWQADELVVLEEPKAVPLIDKLLLEMEAAESPADFDRLREKAFKLDAAERDEFVHAIDAAEAAL